MENSLAGAVSHRPTVLDASRREDAAGWIPMDAYGPPLASADLVKWVDATPTCRTDVTGLVACILSTCILTRFQTMQRNATTGASSCVALQGTNRTMDRVALHWLQFSCNRFAPGWVFENPVLEHGIIPSKLHVITLPSNSALSLGQEPYAAATWTPVVPVSFTSGLVLEMA